MAKRLSAEEKQRRKDARFVAASRRGGRKYRTTTGRRGLINHAVGIFGPIGSTAHAIFAAKPKRKRKRK